MFFHFVFHYVPVKYGDYQYPIWAQILGFCISASSMLWVPGYAVYYLLTQPGTIRENWRSGVTANITMRKDAIVDIEKNESINEAEEETAFMANGFGGSGKT